MKKSYLCLIVISLVVVSPGLQAYFQLFHNPTFYLPNSSNSENMYFEVDVRQSGKPYDNTVLVLVNNTLNSSINSYFTTFVNDIKYGLKCNASLYVYPDSWNNASIRNFLNNTYQNFGLRGAILVGRAPQFTYNHSYYSPPINYQFVWDYYYMDLDCVFNDSDADGFMDTMSGNIGPEIWVSRIDASSLSGNETAYYIDFFTRNHQVRNVGSRGAQKGLLWVDDTWGSTTGSSNRIDQCFARLYNSSNRVLFDQETQTNRSIYLTNLTADYEWLWTCIHSSASWHAFEENQKGVYNWSDYIEINSTSKNMIFYNLYCCYTGNYAAPDYLAGYYIFGNTKGQVSIANSRSGGFLYGTHDFFYDLSTGYCIGDAWKHMYALGYSQSFTTPFPSNNPMAHNLYWKNLTEGNNLFGDPTLQNTQKTAHITIYPIGIVKPNQNVTIRIKLTDSDGWNMYNATIQFLVKKNVWTVIGNNNTNINGITTMTFNTSGIAQGFVPIKAVLVQAPNYQQTESKRSFYLGNPIMLLLPALIFDNTQTDNTILWISAAIGVTIVGAIAIGLYLRGKTSGLEMSLGK